MLSDGFIFTHENGILIGNEVHIKDRYLPKVMDISLLDNLIFSYWQHLNSNKEIFNNKNWFVKTLTRLKQLL